MNATDDPLAQMRRLILQDETFVRATFSGPEKGAGLAWLRVTIRPLLLRGERHWQFSYFDEKKDIARNYLRLEAGQKLDELLALPFRNLTVEAGAARWEARRTKKGKLLLHTSRLTNAAPPDLAHDHAKPRLLAPDTAAPFLQAVGILTPDGRVRAEMQAKLRQINEFVRLVDETGAFEAAPASAPLRVVDFGCGRGYLTFALYHYLSFTLGREAEVVGVDLKADVLEALNRQAQALGWEGLRFQIGSIADYQPPAPPEVVVALHACDTATDDALAQAITWGCRLIVCAPCCQHELQAQMAGLPTPEAFAALARHGILFERLGDLLTDAARAALLRVMGYRAEVIQFVSTEHTAKNLMIRAVKTGPPGSRRAQAEYEALKAYWGFTPYLEKLLSKQ